MADSSQPYTGTDGDEYLAQRQGAVSDHVQSLRASLFTDLASDDRVILDFGCGSGGVLSRLPAKRRVGVELGAAAAKIAKGIGIDVVSDLEQVPSASVDVVISFHAIEHVESPVDVLRELARVARPDASIRLIVPGEVPTHPQQRTWRPNHDRHLHTWTPLLFGNLAEHCGYRDIRTSVAPMPTASRLVRALSPLPPLAKAAHWRLATRRNALNVILDARPPAASAH